MRRTWVEVFTRATCLDNLEIIKAVGYEHVMVDTDGGQTENPHWELALAEYMQYLVDHGIPEEPGLPYDEDDPVQTSGNRRIGGEVDVKCSDYFSDCAGNLSGV